MKKYYIILIIAILIFLIIIAMIYIRENSKPIVEPIPKDENGNEWNQSEINGPSYFNSLYEQGEVPQLDKLLVNSTFIKHVTVNRVPYLYGFSADGGYTVFIYYKEKSANEIANGYLIQIYNSISGEINYTFFIPDTIHILESRELKLAQNALSSDFNITIPPAKLAWVNGMEYKADSSLWNFEEEQDNDRYLLKITNKDMNKEWLILTNHQLLQKNKFIDMFAYPGKADWLTFIIYQNLSKENDDITSFTPIFIQLDSLNTRNSNSGINEEADLWLYGDFEFIYNQWNTKTRKGFIAVSYGKQSEKSKLIEQWTYLDPTGKMKFYGNSQGIYNSEGKPIQKFEDYYYYRINIISSEQHALEYFTIDQFEQKSNKLIRTFEVKWELEPMMMSIQYLESI